MSKKTIYKCLECGGTFEHFNYRYDSSPRGDDESVCPCCGAVEPRATWFEREEKEEKTKLTKEQLENYWDSGYLSIEEDYSDD